MNRKVLTTALAAALLAAPLFAGALTLSLADPQNNSEAKANHAVVLAMTTACTAPENTIITATAEGVEQGQRRTLNLRVIQLASPGTYAVARQWPAEGVWAVRIVTTNPEYRNYATGLVVPVRNNTYSRAAAKQYFHAPTDDEVNSALKQAALE